MPNQHRTHISTGQGSQWHTLEHPEEFGSATLPRNHDNVIVDLTKCPKPIRDDVADFILNKLDPKTFDRIYPIGFRKLPCMSVYISISDEAAKWWMNNSVFAWFVDHLVSRDSVDSSLREAIEIGAAIQGFDLHDISKEDPVLAGRIASVFGNVANDIAMGQIVIENVPPSDSQAVASRFQELRDLMDKWHRAHDQ